VAKFAGDEFVIILPSTSKGQAETYILSVKQKLAKNPVPSDGAIFYIKLSHGLSSIFEKKWIHLQFL
jgi:GGDEF domain-containing protein